MTRGIASAAGINICVCALKEPGGVVRATLVGNTRNSKAIESMPGRTVSQAILALLVSALPYIPEGARLQVFTDSTPALRQLNQEQAPAARLAGPFEQLLRELESLGVQVTGVAISRRENPARHWLEYSLSRSSWHKKLARTTRVLR